MRKDLRFLFITILSIIVSSTSFAEPHGSVITDVKQASFSPEDVLQRLKEGNKRFMSNKMKNRDLSSQAALSSEAQHPLAVVLNCMDSRTAPELVFDQGVGDIFAIRIAGNVQNNDILGSMEFGTKLAGARLIAVIGHTRCGAIQGACQHAKLGHLTSLLKKIKPAMDKADKTIGKHDCTNPVLIDEIAKDNVLMVIKQIQANSPVLRKLIKEGKIGIIGGIQDVSTGHVTFFEEGSKI